MRLRNKKTGEIKEMPRDYMQMPGGRLYYSLAELNEEWEDYEEPKGFWMINILGIVEYTHGLPENEVEMMKQIGNYFETKEEAEKAVEKLKAWKRLKDSYYISFDLDFVKNTISFTYRINGTLHSVLDGEHIVFKDMKTIFGGEE